MPAQKRSYNRYKPLKWTEEKKQFIKDHKDLDHETLYNMLLQEFPGFEVTMSGFKDMRARCKANRTTRQQYSTKQRPLYSEQLKKNYVRIKVAQPNVWMQKQKWVYLETHPWELPNIQETDCFLFLDGNNRNFAPDNIAPIHRHEQAIFIKMGGVVKNDPQQTYINLLNARMYIAALDRGEELGLVGFNGRFRFFIEERNRKARERYKKDYAENPEKYKEWQKKYKANMTEEQKEKARARSRKWAKAHYQKK